MNKEMDRLFRILLSATCLLAAICPLQTAAQTAKYSVSGTVTDTKGEPLAGVFVYVKGTENGTATDLDGKYSISIPVSGTPTLVFQYIGMETREVKVDKSQTLDISLKGDNTLEEAVISAGYGLAQKRSDMTGSAFQVNYEQFKTLPASRVDNILQGMVPGLDIQESANSAARTRYTIRVRGDASLNASSEPLWIVDGVPIYWHTQKGLLPT